MIQHAFYTNNIILGTYLEQKRSPAVWRWAEHNAIAVAGKAGSGKTTAIAFWLAQLASQGVRFIVYDPHAVQKESLFAQVSQFITPLSLLPVAQTVDEVYEYVDFWWVLGKARIENREPAFPLVFVFEEFTSYVLSASERSKKTIRKMLDSANQYRKVNMRTLFAGQSWGQALRAVTSLRDSISFAVVFRSSYNDARKFLFSEAQAREAIQLPTGVAFTTLDTERKIHIAKLNATDRLVAAQRAAKLAERIPTPYPFLRKNEVYLL